MKAILAALAILFSFAAHASEIEVLASNHSGPVLCAEKDNVEIDLTAPDVRSFRIQAVHPAYIGTIVTDHWAPDFTACDMTHDPSFVAKARRITFWETPEFWLTGYTYSSFWRPGNVPFRVGDRVENGLHLVQLWMLHQERAEEILVVYPPDGYWRARPLPPANLRWSAYGSSFLLGPVEVRVRPMVALKDIAFDPATRTFTLNFEAGGSATLRVDKIDEDRIVLEAKISGATPQGLPFAALRSMYATDFNNDVAKLAWRTRAGAAWGESPVMAFKTSPLTELWAGRTQVSRHNLSAPDMVFSHFDDGK